MGQRTAARRWSTRHVGLAAAAVVGLVALAAPATAAPPPQIATPPHGVIPGSFIVTVAAGAAPRSVAADHAAAHAATVDHVFEHALRGYAAHMSETAAARVAADPRVTSVVPDRAVHASARPPSGGGSTTGQSTPTGINRIDGELSSTVAGNGAGEVGVDVAVLDTGIDLTHPELNVAGGMNCSSGTSYADGNGHGTHVAGTIGARDNGAGVVGVAPGARLWAVRVLNNAGSGSWSSIICGIDWVTANATTIEVANMSLGGTGVDTGCNDGGMHEAICASVAAGVTYVVAAGNESDNSANHVPAAYDEVITVSALADFNGLPGGGARATCRSDVDDTFADFSNYGTDVDIIAPGVCINSTWKGGGYKSISGTSMASPHVAGAAALVKAADPTASPTGVKAALLTRANIDWNDADDPDSYKEHLLNLGGF